MKLKEFIHKFPDVSIKELGKQEELVSEIIALRSHIDKIAKYHLEHPEKVPQDQISPLIKEVQAVMILLNS